MPERFRKKKREAAENGYIRFSAVFFMLLTGSDIRCAAVKSVPI